MALCLLLAGAASQSFTIANDRFVRDGQEFLLYSGVEATRTLLMFSLLYDISITHDINT